MTTTIHVSDPGALLAVVPYQLGYRPARSVLVIAMHGKEMGPMMRADLPPLELVEEMAEQVASPVFRQRAEWCFVVGYEDVEGEAMAALDAVADALEAGGVAVEDILVVRDGRWFVPDCHGGCCPAAGRPVPRDSDVPDLAELVAAERAPLEGRDDIGRLCKAGALACAGVREEVELTAAVGRRPGAARETALWADILDCRDDARPVEDLAPAEVARAVRALDERSWRDALIAWAAPSIGWLDAIDDALVRTLEDTVARPPDTAVGHTRVLARLLALCRRVPDTCRSEVAAVCTVAAAVAWSHGDGALARDALDRALLARPAYRLAALLHGLVCAGVPPTHRAA